MEHSGVISTSECVHHWVQQLSARLLEGGTWTVAWRITSPWFFPSFSASWFTTMWAAFLLCAPYPCSFSWNSNDCELTPLKTSSHNKLFLFKFWVLDICPSKANVTNTLFLIAQWAKHVYVFAFLLFGEKKINEIK